MNVEEEPAGGEMDALCPELLLPTAGEVGSGGGHGASIESVVGTAPLTVGQSLLLTDASMAGDGARAEAADVEIFVEAVAGNVSLSSPGNATEVLVKVVELYFCERCGQSFSDPSLLSQHQCITLAAPRHLELPAGELAGLSQLPGELPALPSECRGEPAVCQEPAQSSPEASRPDGDLGAIAEQLLCPVCGGGFVLPSELKEHFKTHRRAQGALTCPEKGCHFTSEDRQQLRGHLRRAHKVSPVSCTYRTCPLLFRSRQDMKLHHRSHFPFHCGRCDFVSSNAKLFRRHTKSHSPASSGGGEPPAETGCMEATCKCDFTAMAGHLPSKHLRLHSADGETVEEAENALDQTSWEAAEQAAGHGVSGGTRETSDEGQRMSAEEEDSESAGDELLEEEVEESACEAETKGNGKVTSKKSKAPGAQAFKGDVAEGSEYLFKTHMCPECKRCFKKRTHLVEHLHLHFPDPSLQCPNCQKYFTSKSKLKIHMMRETGEKAHRCPLCHYSSVEKNALNRHMASMHENISNFYSDVYTCPVCQEPFRLSQALKEHLKTHKAEPKRLSCFQGDCGYCTEDRKEFIRHLKETHGIKAVECKYHACSLLFGTAEAMEAHRKTHYAFHCQQCDFICSNKHVFRKHKKQGHPGSEQLQCGFCPYATFNPVEFHDHVGKMHANEKIHKCTECGFATAHKRVLIRHMLLHTGEKPHKCELCDFTCRDVSYLSKHMLTHSDDKNYMCTECGYVTKWKHYLNVHMRKHTGDLRYHCNQCSYRCHRADQLSSHKLRHQGKSLICEVCGFACKRKYELQKHMQVKHSQNYQMPVFQCQYCSYQTKYKQALLNHENCKHTKQKEFRCALCSYCTFSNTSLFFHKRKIHGYVPGDKDWLENYASKELEVSSADVLLNYDISVALRSDSNSSLSGKELWQKSKPSALEPQQEPYQQAFVVPLFGPAPGQLGGSAEMAQGLAEEERGPSADMSPLEDSCVQASSAVAEDPGMLTDAGDAVESCTLHLETLNVSADPLLGHVAASESLAAQPDNADTLSCKDPAYEVLSSRDALVLEDNDTGLEDVPDFEEEPEIPEPGQVRLEDGAGSMVCSVSAEESHEKDTQQGPEDCCDGQCSDLPSVASDTDAAPEIRQASTQEAWFSLIKPAEPSHFPAPEDPTSLCDEAKAGPQSELVLKALRKQDKEQAETLVLEGRVQMLVVQSESQIFKCEKCSYVTRKEKSMALHDKAGCQSRKAPLVCRGCSASFKQQRGLNTHLLKKCPVILRKNKLLKPAVQEQPGSPGLEQAGVENGRGGLEEGEASRVPETWELDLVPVKASSTSRPFPEALSVGSPAPSKVLEDAAETVVEEAAVPGDRAQVEEAKCPSPPEKYRLEQGKLHCNSCSFVCSRVSTISSHVEDGCRSLEQFWCSLCSKAFRSGRALKSHHLEKHVKLESSRPPGEEGSAGARPPEEGAAQGGQQGTSTAGKEKGRPRKAAGVEAARKAARRKRRRFSCPTCAFTCHQERAMKTHKKRGCVKLDEFHCPTCPFTSKAASALRLHRKLHRKYYSKRPQLQCRQCAFTCKQARCLRQHVRIKHEGVKPHKCLYCDFSTTRRYRLEAHESLHTGVGRIACGVCSQTFGTNSKLRIHKLRVHEKKPTHFCLLCDYSGYLQNDITRHVNSCHRGELRFACARCEARFSSETALKQHVLRRHEEKVSHSCPRCGFVCHSEATLKCHAQKQHPHLECGTCKESFASREALEEHKTLHFSHRCDRCSFAAKERQQLVRHYVESHEPAAAQEKPLKCPFCDFACHHQLVFDHHVKGHGGTRVYKCSDCHYTTKNKQKITWHIRIHTGEKPYKCHLCKYACADPSRLKYHMRIHKEERKYLCPDCGYKCKWVNQLKYHMTKHTGLKPYRCDECEYCTNRADALRIHKETRHREARSFICEQCGKAFKTRFLLKTHLKKHSEEKPYVCNVCYRGFRWAAGLRHHYLTHTNEHPFFCRFCSYKAKQKFQVIKHIQRHHPDCGPGELSQGVGKDTSAPTLHLHDVQLEPADLPPKPEGEAGVQPSVNS
ncbi:zinc finger protein 142 [Emydura macquarii macquarii]|uniref:zinc finger protein 142 n=1 Tax=Emydura macquarii macquarii TaxID=1129001 RepID=UPI00352AA08B